MSSLSSILLDTVYGHPPYDRQELRNPPGERTLRTRVNDLSKLPVATSKFCLVRLDDKDNLFMTGVSAQPEVEPARRSFLYR